MRSDISSLKTSLNNQVKTVCQYLYPGGKVDAGEYVYDPGQGKIKVVLDGAKKGVWAHFGGDGGGDLIDLWRKSRGGGMPEALNEIREYLGVEQPRFRKPAREFTRPERPQGMRKPVGPVQGYLMGDRRLSEEAIAAYKIGAKGNHIIFPFLRDGELIMAKSREAVAGANPKPTSKNCEKILFGWQAIDPDAREVYITEGEIDAVSMYDFGFPALSVPFGGGKGNKQDWIENEFHNLDRFEKIYLCLDNDQPGQEAVAEIAQRLGRHRCRVVELPRKDANQCLVDGCTDEEIRKAVAEAADLDPEMLRRPNEYIDNVIKLFHPDGEEPGYSLPFDRASQLRFRGGEVSIWSGASGSGKSQILSACIVHWFSGGSKVCLASLEMAPAQTLRRMVKQVGNLQGDRPTERYARACIEWLDDGLWLVDRVGKLTVDELLDVFIYARERYGCDQFVVDSMMRLGLEADDYVGQEKLMYRMVDWSIDSGCHLHVVAHSRKSFGGSGVPGTEDIKGAAEIGWNAFNIISIWRNRLLEQDIADESTSEEEREKLKNTPGVIMHVSKQRNGDWEGKVALHFSQNNYQYRDGLGSRFGREYVDPGSMRDA